MIEAAVRKNCRVCGADLRHKNRRKSHDGTYLCPECHKDNNRWPRRLIRTLAGKQARRLVFTAFATVLVCSIFWKILEAVANRD